ncbi:unnamed protein product [Lymnaea stagnalis]|uniref:Nuclear RNA export factor 1 n=1 Tax=Lymnaea stagnalis TaxID=6523 RepID=A0AAV2IBZ4_LYMST
MSYSKSDNFSVVAGRDGSRSFKGDHDDRWNNNVSNRGSNYNRGPPRGNRGSRNNRRSGYRNFNAGSSRFRNRLENVDEDGDVSMAGDSSGRGQGSRFNPYGNNRSRARGNNRGGRGGNNRGLDPAAKSAAATYRKTESWFKIMIPFGAALPQDELFKMIISNIDGPFDPIKYSTDEKRAYFFVKGVEMADSLRAISRRIKKPDGHLLIFHVSPSQPPVDPVVDKATIEKLKIRMSDRYDPSTQVLNLSALFSDDVLTQENIFLPLNRASTMAAVTKIIGENIPELVGLDVSKNKLLSLGHLTDLVKVTPNVQSLNLGENQLRSIDELDKLKGWQNIVEVVLKGNDLCKNFSNQGAYISAVRKTFPKVVKLDGTDYPPPITFDLETNLVLPPCKESYFINDDIKGLVVTFIKEYYSIYDSDRRKELMPAYHDNAQFSICSVNNPLLERQIGFKSYYDDSRNLKKIGHFDAEKLAKKIKTGVLSVISTLENLPKTTHDVNSFKVDVCTATPTMLCFILQGVFKEIDARSDKPLIRSFCRSFITVPSGPGMVITNDMLTISNAGIEQTRNAFKEAAPTPSSSPVSSSQYSAGPSTSQNAARPPAPFLSPEKMHMLENFVAQSNMNPEFSLKCLEENNWDYLKAGQVFTDLNNQGRIPPEAFVKSEIVS